MYTDPPLNTQQLALYHERLQDDHDYNVWVDVLTMEEDPITSVVLLDGQVNVNEVGGDGPDRTGTLTLSDPEGVLDWGASFARDNTNTLWLKRLVRVNHSLYVPKLGFDVRTQPLLGLPKAASRKGAEISLEVADKSAISSNGVRPQTWTKGTNVRTALIQILQSTGETKFRIPETTKTLSTSYSVGMGQNAASPWVLFKRIAGTEMGWRSFYSLDGFATCEATSTSRISVPIESIMTLPDSSSSFETLANYAKVTTTSKTAFEAVATLPPEHELSEQELGRNGRPRTLPVVIEGDETIKNSESQVKARAVSELASGSELSATQSYETIPMFHLDNPDKLILPEGIGEVAMVGSIPLGTGGNMSLGKIRWVSKAVTVSGSRVAFRKYKTKK